MRPTGQRARAKTRLEKALAQTNFGKVLKVSRAGMSSSQCLGSRASRRSSYSPLDLKYFNMVQTAACCSSSISFGSRYMRRTSDGFLASIPNMPG